MVSTTVDVIFITTLAEDLAQHQTALRRDPGCRGLEPLGHVVSRGTLSSVSLHQRVNGCIPLLGARMICGEPALVLSDLSCNTVPLSGNSLAWCDDQLSVAVC